MEPVTIIAMSITGLTIWLILIFVVIKAATRTNEQIKLQKVQTKLLIKLLQGKGITNEEIEQTIKIIS